MVFAPNREPRGGSVKRPEGRGWDRVSSFDSSLSSPRERLGLDFVLPLYVLRDARSGPLTEAWTALR